MKKLITILLILSITIPTLAFFIRLDCAMVFTPYTGKPDLGFK